MMWANTIYFLLMLSTPHDVIRKVESALLIGDHKYASEMSKKGLEDHPDAPSCYEMRIKVLAAEGKEAEMLRVWKEFHDKFETQALKAAIVEEMCWGILKKGEDSNQLGTRLVAILGSAITQDAQALKILKRGLHDSNAVLRALSVELSSHFGDESLKEEIVWLFYHEGVWQVRERLYEAIAKLQIQSLREPLFKVIKDKRVDAEEKTAAIKSIAALEKKCSKEEIKTLISSRFAAERILGATLIADSLDATLGELLIPLLTDSDRDVKKSALETWGMLRLKATPEIKRIALSKESETALTASWVLLMEEKEGGEEAFISWLGAPKAEIRIRAAAALGSTGSYGTALMKRALQESVDPYVRANLALGLIKQREMVEEASEILYTFLKETKEKVMWGEGFFTPLQKSMLSHHSLIPNYPEAVNQAVRLEILNLLAIVEYPRAQEAIKEFLKERRWEVVGLAAETLLQEGDESAIELVQNLLNDPDKQIRTEAALLLASWSHESTSMAPLLEAYPYAERSLKIKILESLARLGSKEALPFLLERLEDPSQTLRIIAAAVLILTLNH